MPAPPPFQESGLATACAGLLARAHQGWLLTAPELWRGVFVHTADPDTGTVTHAEWAGRPPPPECAAPELGCNRARDGAADGALRRS